jgi:hypothetical protein
MIPPGLLDTVRQLKHVFQRRCFDLSHWMILFPFQWLVSYNVLRGDEEIVRVIDGVFEHRNISFYRA